MHFLAESISELHRFVSPIIFTIKTGASVKLSSLSYNNPNYVLAIYCVLFESCNENFTYV